VTDGASRFLLGCQALHSTAHETSKPVFRRLFQEWPALDSRLERKESAMAMSAYLRRLRERVGHDLLEIPSVTVAVRDEKNRLLLARHSAGDVWVMPGGAVEPEETPADAAVREAWEETGLLVDLARIVGVYGGPECTVRYRNGDACSYFMVVFEGRAVRGSARPDGQEVLEIGYFREAEIASLQMARWMPEVLSDVFRLRQRREADFRRPTWCPPAVA